MLFATHHDQLFFLKLLVDLNNNQGLHVACLQDKIIFFIVNEY